MNRLSHRIVWDESSDSIDAVSVIPSHHRITLQILSHWKDFRDLNLMFVDSSRSRVVSRVHHQTISRFEKTCFFPKS